MVAWLRQSQSASVVLLLVRLYLGYTWITSGWGKISGGGFATEGFLKGAIEKASGDHPSVQGWWAAFLENFALPGASFFNFLIPWGEFLVGLALLLGLLTTFAGLMGISMNYAFLFSGTVSINPYLILLTTFILIAGRNAGYFGLDRLVLPYWDKKRGKQNMRLRKSI
ncbi:DoxX family membrane protein [Brevibacillus laterosporus]|nr:DoxX family membrane protein [Brevibacillus laterosporus]AYB41169.1 DoxX family membrane protein [Brevibacillus laterosporus]MBM7110048.1 DoxX [Brevibacillus laterosporus]NKQ20977.1 DoxX family membrane protein [Brevibacillus laterosporus]WNX30664.1 DoxX family membrane protein [Brevibacillus laterosporus]